MSDRATEILDPELLRQVRTKVCDALSITSVDDYDVSDLETNVKSRDILVRIFSLQYIEDHGWKSAVDDEKAQATIVKTIVDAMKWRKTIGVTRLTLSDFSPEFFTRGYFRVGESGDTVTIVMDFGRHKKISAQVSSMEMAFFLVFTERFTMEQFAKGRRVVVIFDHTNYSLTNMDGSFMLDFFSLISAYYPSVISQTLAYELPWYLKPVVSMAKAILPKRMTKSFDTVDRRSILAVLEKDQVPKWMGGDCDCKVLSVESTKDLKEVASAYGVTEADLNKLTEYYTATASLSD